MVISLPCFGIIITLGEDARSGTIVSDLRNSGDSPELTAAMDAIESLILAHACAGVDVATSAYVEGVETAVEACWNRLG